MPKRKHSDAAIVAALTQVDAGPSAADIAREVGVSVDAMYARKAKYGEMEASEG